MRFGKRLLTNNSDKVMNDKLTIDFSDMDNIQDVKNDNGQDLVHEVTKNVCSVIRYLQESISGEHPILIVGTAALVIQGYPILTKEPGDIDLYIGCGDDIKSIKQKLKIVENSQIKSSFKSYPNEPDLFIIEIKGVVVNVWLVDKIKEPILRVGNIPVATALNILREKTKLKRHKDYRYLNYIIHLLTSFAE